MEKSRAYRNSPEYRERKIEEEKRKTEEKEYKECDIPIKFENARLKDIIKNVSACDTRCVNMAIEYTKNLENNIKNGYGLILVGGVGTMKTSTAVAILKRYHEVNGDTGGMFLNMCELVSNIFSKDIDWFNKEKRIKETCHLLILDDLGAENIKNAWVKTKIDEIITTRYNNKLSTIITSNYSIEDLCKMYSERMIDRLCEVSILLEYSGESKRKNLEVEKIIDYHNQMELNF